MFPSVYVLIFRYSIPFIFRKRATILIHIDTMQALYLLTEKTINNN